MSLVAWNSCQPSAFFLRLLETNKTIVFLVHGHHPRCLTRSRFKEELPFRLEIACNEIRYPADYWSPASFVHARSTASAFASQTLEPSTLFGHSVCRCRHAHRPSPTGTAHCYTSLAWEEAGNKIYCARFISIEKFFCASPFPGASDQQYVKQCTRHQPERVCRITVGHIQNLARSRRN